MVSFAVLGLYRRENERERERERNIALCQPQGKKRNDYKLDKSG